MADLQTTWISLAEGIDHIMTRLHQGVTFSKYMSMYSAAYDYCVSSQMGNYGSGGGSDLYTNLSRYFSLHVRSSLENMRNLENEALLSFYSQQWTRYTTGARYVSQLFMYLNRQWVKSQREEGKTETHQIDTLALVKWRDCLFRTMQRNPPKLTEATLWLIERHRNGENINQDLVRTLVESFVALGIDDKYPNRTCLDVYNDYFETAFIEATKTYYEHESEAFLEIDHGISSYLTRVEEILKEEEDRVDRYLHSQTRKALITTCEQVLIHAHKQIMWDSFQSLLDYDKEPDLKRIYDFLSRVPDGLEPLRHKFGQYVKNSGLNAISTLMGEGGVEAIKPKEYVDGLLGIHRKNSETATRCFKADVSFVASLDKACHDFVNCNAATTSSSSKSAELIAKHVDSLLRKNSKIAEDSDLESELNSVMTLCKYIEDKDVFQNFYAMRLSKRLIHGVSVSDESETSMISKLREVCGFDYTAKLQRMFTDMSLSKDLTDQFQDRMRHTHGDLEMNFNALVLGTNIWPVNPPSHDFLVPRELQTTYNGFQRFYQMKHTGRRLAWLWNYCKNELRTNYLNQKYTFMTSTYQTAVLLQYNEHDTMSLEELMVATAMTKEILTQVLEILVKGKVLIHENSEQYDLNFQFTVKKIRVNLNQPIKTEAKIETNDVMNTVDADRRCMIQASIVRIMKSRKTMKYQPLIQEVVSQISHRFTPKIPDIKKAMETLLEKEFLERVEGAKDTYAYVA